MPKYTDYNSADSCQLFIQVAIPVVPFYQHRHQGCPRTALQSDIPSTPPQDARMADITNCGGRCSSYIITLLYIYITRIYISPIYPIYILYIYIYIYPIYIIQWTFHI